MKLRNTQMLLFRARNAILRTGCGTATHGLDLEARDNIAYAYASTGANAISGDFSLIAQGYTVKGGKKEKAVDRITVAGNFFQLLKNIRAVGSDLLFPGSSTGSPSVYIGEIVVAGTRRKSFLKKRCSSHELHLLLYTK